MRSSRPNLRLTRLEDRAVPANIFQVEPIWINPTHINEFKPDGTLVRQIATPTNDPRDVVVSPNGDIQLFDGTFSPRLATYHPSTGTWTYITTPGWSTVNNLSYGGIAAYGDYVYVTDMQTAYETPPYNGIVRFNMADGTVERFAEGHDFIAMCLGLDGFIYAMGGQTGMGNDIYKYDPDTMAFLGTFRANVPDGRGVAVGANGDYYVADWGNSVVHYDSAGNFIRSVGAGNGAVDVSLDGQVVSGNMLMDLDLNYVGTVGDGNYHTGFATPQIPDLTPVLSNIESDALTYRENDPATTITTTMQVTDVHSTTIAGATVAISQNFIAGEDQLSFADANGITGNYNSSTGVLNLTGVASIADYQAALRSVKYQNTSDNPSQAARLVTFQVDDGAASHNLSNIVSRTINVLPDNDAPTIMLPANDPVGHEDQPMAVDGIAVGDVDAAGGSERLTLSVPQGVILFGDLSSVNVVGGGNNTSMIEIEGTIPGLNQALRDGNLSFVPSAGLAGDVILSLGLDDEGNSGQGGPRADSKTLTLHITPNPPQLTGIQFDTLTYTEGRVSPRVGPKIKVAAGNPTLAEAKVAITGNFVASEDVLLFRKHRLINESFDPATGILTLSGTATVAQYQWVLRGVRYSNSSKNPSTVLRTVSFQAYDGVSGNPWSNVVTRSIQIRPVNTRPMLTVPVNPVTTAQNLAVAINGISVGDVDANGGLIRVTLRVTKGTIEFVNLGTVTITDGVNNSSMIAIVGTLADLNSVLADGNLIYQPPADYVGAAALHLALNDLGNTGAGKPRERRGSVHILVV